MSFNTATNRASDRASDQATDTNRYSKRSRPNVTQKCAHGTGPSVYPNVVADHQRFFITSCLSTSLSSRPLAGPVFGGRGIQGSPPKLFGSTNMPKIVATLLDHVLSSMTRALSGSSAQNAARPEKIRVGKLQVQLLPPSWLPRCLDSAQLLLIPRCSCTEQQQRSDNGA